MLLRAVDFDVLRALADRVDQRRIVIELLAQLIEISCGDARAAPYPSAVRLQLAEDQLEQRRLAGAVRPDEADLVAAQYARGKIA